MSSDRHRLAPGVLQLGAPVPMDVYDAGNRLLLRRGVVVSTQVQLDRLMEDGLYADSDEVEAFLARRRAARAHAAGPPPPGYVPAVAGDKVSACARLADAKRALLALLSAPPAAGFAERLLAIAQSVHRTAELDVDAALGQVALDRSATPAARHMVNVAAVTALLLGRLKRPASEIDAAVCAALTMNCTSLALHDQMHGQSTPPDAAQRAQLDSHPMEAVARLRELGVTDAAWLLAVMQHHELRDGSGYPAHRSGDDITLLARALALADQVCALMAERVHRDPVNGVLVMHKLREAPPATLDPALCAALTELATPYPPGAAVKLVTGDVAIVSRRTRLPTAPAVMVFVDRNGVRLEEPRKKITHNPLTAIESHAPHGLIQPLPAPDEVWDEVFALEHGPS